QPTKEQSAAALYFWFAIPARLLPYAGCPRDERRGRTLGRNVHVVVWFAVCVNRTSRWQPQQQWQSQRRSQVRRETGPSMASFVSSFGFANSRRCCPTARRQNVL